MGVLLRQDIHSSVLCICLCVLISCVRVFVTPGVHSLYSIVAVCKLALL